MRISDWSSDVCSSDLPTSASIKKRKILRLKSLTWLFGFELQQGKIPPLACVKIHDADEQRSRAPRRCADGRQHSRPPDCPGTRPLPGRRPAAPPLPSCHAVDPIGTAPGGASDVT